MPRREPTAPATRTRRRLIWFAPILAAVAVAAVAVGTIALSGRGSSPAPFAPAASAPQSVRMTSAAPASSSSAQPTPVPAGKPFQLYTHCGIEFTQYAGHEWKATTPMADPQRLPDKNGITAYTGFISGRMAQIDKQTLKFVVTDPTVAINGQTIVFHRTTTTSPPCQ